MNITKAEHKILEEAIKRGQGLYSPSDMYGIAGHDRALVENLVAKGFLSEVSQPVPDFPGASGSKYVNFYRVTEKGLRNLEPWYKKFWLNLKGDIRTIIITIITAVITTLITIFLEKILR